jgi:hypothetical protein
MSLSLAWNRPVRSLGEIAASRVSSFTVGSARAQISVVCTLEWPSQSETFRMSFVAWRIVIAQVCLKTCGDTRFNAREGQRLSAMQTCFRRMYSNPARVIHPRRALINSSGAEISPLTESQARTAGAVSFHTGTQRSRRPLPWIRTLGSGWSLTSTTRTPINSDTHSTSETEMQHCAITNTHTLESAT